MPLLMTQTNGDVTVVYFTEGQILDAMKINAFEQELAKVADKVAGGKVLLNFNDVRFLASEALGKLILLNKRCKADKTEVKLSNIGSDIMEIFKVTAMHKMFDIHEEEAQAISAFNKKKWGLF